MPSDYPIKKFYYTALVIKNLLPIFTISLNLNPLEANLLMPNGKKKLICKKIKELRIAHKFTQEQVAEVLCMSQNTYSEWETGKTKLDIERLYQLADLYSVSIYEILDESPEEF